MCGILGIISASPAASNLDKSVVVAMRDRLSHRGPDDAGVWHGAMGWVAHRRLEVLDTTSAGHQPMISADGRYVIVYNGELYNDLEIRAELRSTGVRFTTHCDTQTVLYAVAQWGLRAASRLRGMYALAVLDTHERVVYLGRDPMGIKPLYCARAGVGESSSLVFGSEIPAILAHPQIGCAPDWVTASAYLSSIRTVLGSRTMFEGVDTFEPGEWRRIPLDAEHQTERISVWDEIPDTSVGVEDPIGLVRGSVEDSVRAHLRTDVPMCSLLSGGLDSAIITMLAKRELGELRTYCAGAKIDGFDDDFQFARMLADNLGTVHTEVVVDREQFAASWSAMIEHTGVPMSTPNEVAINAVARALRADGHIVALTGEGADELFGGYAPAMMQAHDHVQMLTDRSDPEGGLFHLESNAWINRNQKPLILNPDVWESAGADEQLRDEYRRVFRGLRRSGTDGSGLQTHLRFLRRMNLANLLQRLDSATMQASVEGRTPIADIRLAALAESLPMDAKFTAGDEPRTKIALRDAFRDDLPEEIVNRPKQSFPMPFQSWVSQHSEVLRTSAFARSVFTNESIELVCADPQRACMFAWPMINLALWGERWWGDGISAPIRALSSAAQ